MYKVLQLQTVAIRLVRPGDGPDMDEALSLVINPVIVRLATKKRHVARCHSEARLKLPCVYAHVSLLPCLVPQTGQ
jgi:hypothetical protein